MTHADGGGGQLALECGKLLAMPKKTKYAEDKEAKLKRVLGRIKKHTNKTSSSRNPPQLPSTLSGYERESRDAESKIRDSRAATKH
jgi:hypothetical protein